VALSWEDLPIGRVVRLPGVNADTTALSIEPPPDGAPAILSYFPGAARSVAEMVAAVLGELEKAAVELFPAWVPGAEGLDGPGGGGVHAVRTLALRMASAGHHFGPFLAHLAESSLTGVVRPSSRFSPEVRAIGLARVLAEGFGRPRAAILVQVPGGLSAAEEEVLVSGCEWLADRGRIGVWLTGTPLVAVDRLEQVATHLPDAARLARERPRAPGRPRAPIRYPAVAGRPHPASKAEKALEAALSSCAWAAGRAWNQTYRSHPLINPIRVDLLWREERCVVEIDGDDHHERGRYAQDRQRDVRLQLDGYAVLRFTNDQVLTDTEAVVGQVGRFLRGRRAGTSEGMQRA
jgi:very-short-patch-repair endonuclease